jgi:peptidyl-prolyl cis-trans isomerase D
MRDMREQVARRLASLYQSQFQQPLDQRTFAMISNGISNRELAEFAAGVLTIDELAERYEIVVTPAQVSENLRNQGITNDVLRQILTQRRQREVDFFAEQARGLRTQRAAEILTNSARVSLPELWQEYSMTNSKVSIDFVNLQVFELESGIEVSDEDAATWFNENADRYVQPEQRVYRFVAFGPPEVELPVEPSDEDIQQFYDAINIEEDIRFANPSGLEIRQIVISSGSDGPEAARASLEAIAARIAAGEDFAALANELSDDIHNIRFSDDSSEDYVEPSLGGGLLPERLSATNQGEWQSEYGTEWLTAVQSLNAGDPATIVPVNGGVALVRVEALHEGGKRPLEEVRELIRRDLRSERVVKRRELQMAAIDEMEPRFREAIAQSTSLDSVAAAVGKEVQVLAPLDSQNYTLPSVGSLFTHRELMSRLEVGEISPVMRTSGNPPTLVSLQIEAILPERPQSFEEAKSRATSDLRAHRAQANISELTTKLMAAVESGSSLRDAAESLELLDKFESIDQPFDLRTPPPGLITMPDAQREFGMRAIRSSAGSAFVLENKIPSSDRLFSSAVVYLKERIEPDRAAFIAEVSQFEQGIMAVKMQTVLEAFKRESLQRLNVTFDEDYIREEDPRASRRRRS